MTENSDASSQVQAVMKKDERVKRPRHQVAGANGDVNGRLVAWARQSPKETAALINPHVGQGLGRKKKEHASLGMAQAKDATSSATELVREQAYSPYGRDCKRKKNRRFKNGVSADVEPNL